MINIRSYDEQHANMDGDYNPEDPFNLEGTLCAQDG